MIKNRTLLWTVLSLIIFTGGCGDDEATTPDYFKDVPKGDIVILEERDEVLTGSSTATTGRMASSQKWWKHKLTKLDYTGCEGAEDEEITVPDYYYAFTSDGDVYFKQGETGTRNFYSNWEWSDSKKEAIILDIDQTVVFKLTALNANELIYASHQGEAGCSVLTWEQFTDPIFEVEEENTGEPDNVSDILGNDLTHSPYISIVYGGDENYNAPRFPSKFVEVLEYSEFAGMSAHYNVTIGTGDGEPELEIVFPGDIATGKIYQVDDLEINYSNSRPFDEGYTLQYMQEIVNIENKGAIKIIYWDKEARNLALDFGNVHLVYFKLCSADCSVSSPTYDGGYQYNTDYVNIHGGITTIFKYRKVI